MAKVTQLKSNAPLTAVIDDGTREVSIVNKFGKLVCKVYFRPADLSIIDRYNAMIKNFDGIVKPLETLEIRNDGTAAFEKDWEILKKVELDLKQKLMSFSIWRKQTRFSQSVTRFHPFMAISLLRWF